MMFHPDRWSGGDGTDQAAGLTLADDEELESSIVALKAHIDGAQAQLALRIAEYDRRGLAERRHVLTTTQWLSSACRLTARGAAATVRLGRTLSALPGLATPALIGEIPIESARTLAAVQRRHEDEFAAHGDVLIDAATHLTPRELHRAVDHWAAFVAPDEGEGDVRERVERRHLSMSQTFEGMWAITGDLDPESGHVVASTLRAIADPGNLDPEDRRNPGQRRVDALTEACRFWLDHQGAGTTSGGAKPQIAVTVDYETLTGRTTAPSPHTVLRRAGTSRIDGTRVSPEAIRRLACDAHVVRIVMAGASEVLDVGRATRVISAALRRALDHRDGGCTWPGCDAPLSWCDAHHIRHWARGGSTALDNLRLLCRRHHTAIHDRERPRPARRSRSPDP